MNQIPPDHSEHGCTGEVYLSYQRLIGQCEISDRGEIIEINVSVP